MTPEIEARRAEDAQQRIVAELSDVARRIERAEAEAARLRGLRLRLWREGRGVGLSFRAIAEASGIDHAQVAKSLKEDG